MSHTELFIHNNKQKDEDGGKRLRFSVDSFPLYCQTCVTNLSMSVSCLLVEGSFLTSSSGGMSSTLKASRSPELLWYVGLPHSST